MGGPQAVSRWLWAGLICGSLAERVSGALAHPNGLSLALALWWSPWATMRG